MKLLPFAMQGTKCTSKVQSAEIKLFSMASILATVLIYLIAKHDLSILQ